MQQPGNSGTAAIVIGLCALLGSSTTLGLALGLGLVMFVALLVTSLLLTASRRVIPPPLHGPTIVLYFTGTVTAEQLLTAAAWPTLHVEIAPFLPLLAAGGLLLPCTELFAPRHRGSRWIASAISSGAAFVVLATLLGGIRELAGQGSLFRDLSLLIEPFAKGDLRTAGLLLIHEEGGIQLAALLPGALVALGLVAALFRGILARIRSA